MTLGKPSPGFVDICIIASIFGAAVWAAWAIAPAGVPMATVDMAKLRLQQAQANAARARLLPELPLLESAWRDINIEIGHCGLAYAPQGQMSVEDLRATGGPPFWAGSLQGDAGLGLACLYSFVARYPFSLTSLHIDGHHLEATYRLYGRLEPTTFEPVQVAQSP